MTESRCRFCAASLTRSFCDLGMSPPSNSYLTSEQLNEGETFFPLHAFVCEQCFLVQLGEFQSPDEIFSEYAYFSSYSDSWMRHASDYAAMIEARAGLTRDSLVIEIASNDGYLLRNFVARGIPVLGIEPARNVARVAEEQGVRTLVRFFGTEVASELAASGEQGDLIAANNVLAHVPDLNDFVAGLKLALKPAGMITVEFPHLERLIEENQFDTIYHEHFSYFSFLTAQALFAAHGLTLFDVEELPTHGGSLRIYARHAEHQSLKVSEAVTALAARERSLGLAGIAAYESFAERVKATKRNLLEFLVTAKKQGKRIAGYGAAAKGNTLLNYCGIRGDFLDYVVDRNPYKQGKFLPGTHIPILDPGHVAETRPDYLLILPWNIKDEVVEKMSEIRDWGGRFVIPIPRVEVQ